MPVERTNRVSDLHHRALQLAVKERSGFLRQACEGDEPLRLEVESLLQYESATFLERPAAWGRHGLADQIGPYRILERLGTGGMGEVYRAHDTGLGRDVAIKILPLHFLADPERRARFAREARLLATLNHPHIGVIHGLEEADGVTALVLELVDGPTLAERLERGPLPTAEAIAIARQVANALDEAHEKGIIHRDLKPANIVLQGASADGFGEVRAKVLDFGLAKTLTVFANTETVPQLAATGTGEGRILGTPAYMSPEQARGLPVDKRTDIWAFGCVLFEMLSGRRPFDGETVTDTFARILEREPDWGLLPIDTPAHIRKLVERCLRKDPRKRLHDIADALIQLDDQSEASSAAPGTTGPSSDRGLVLDLLRRHGVVATATLLGAAALVAAAMTATWRYARASLEPTADIVPITASGNVFYPAISPDRRFVAFVRQGGIWLSQLSGDVPQKDILILGRSAGSDYRHLTFSPDGNAIDYTNGTASDRALWRVGLLGGPPRQIVTNAWSAAGWSPNRQQLAFVRTTGIRQDTSIVVVDSDGSHEHVLATRHPPAGFTNGATIGQSNCRPSWSPDGKILAVGGYTAGDTSEIVLLDANDGRERDRYALTFDAFVRQAEWLDAERLLVEVATPPPDATAPHPVRIGLPHIGLSLLHLRTRTWAPVTHEAVATLQNFSLTASKDTALALRTERRFGLWLADASGANSRILVDVNPAGVQRLTVDDSGAVWYTSVIAKVLNLYRIQAGSTDSTFVFGDIADYAITPDGGTIVVENSDGSFVRMKADGSDRKIIATDTEARGLAISATHHAAVYWSNGIYAVNLDDGTHYKVTDQMALSMPQISPSGDRVAFVSGRGVVTVCDLSQCAHPMTVPLGISLQRGFGWAPDGQSLAFSPSDDRQNLWAQPLDGRSSYPLTHFGASEPQVWGFAWSRDGRHLALARGRYFDDLALIKLHR